MADEQVQADAEAAMAFIIEALRDDPDQYAEHGYDVYLRHLMVPYIAEHWDTPRNWTHAQKHAPEVAPAFYAAAWELCRAGILRPGVNRFNEMGADLIDGYSYMPGAREWFAGVEPMALLPITSSRFASQLDDFAGRHGPGYGQRAREACGCYFGQQYYACCAMAGAAAESILLALATAKDGDQKKVLKAYQSSQGRRNVTNAVLKGVGNPIEPRFRNLLDQLSHWRDATAHGAAVTVGEVEASTALMALLRLAHLAHDRWDDLTAPPAP